jgi:hypothetical protein
MASNDLDFSDLGIGEELIADGKVLANRVLDVGKRFGFGLAFGPAPGETRD